MANSVLMGALSNTLFACGLALLTLVVARLSRNPHLAHTLWLLVLIKLVTPSFVEIPIAGPLAVAQRQLPTGVPAIKTHSSLVPTSDFTHAHTQRSPTLDTRGRVVTATAQPTAFRWSDILLSGWFLGTIVFIGVALRRKVNLSRLIAQSPPAKTDLVDDANWIAARMGLPVSPRIRTTTARISPLITGTGRRAVILLPQRMLTGMSRDQTHTVLAHELAHLRRRDHLVQLLKFVVLAGQWFNPIAWWASRQLERSQEECCDAWVVWALPNLRRAYGNTLLQTVEFLTEPRFRPVVSETCMSHCNLERRIEMVMKQTVPRSHTPRTIATALVTGVVFLPTAFTFAIATESAAPIQTPSTLVAQQEGDTTPQSTKPPGVTPVATADLPYMIEFDQGATRFLDGDEITIEEIRGTAKTFEPGHIYRIKGTYKLASRDKATVAAFTTAANVSDGKSRSLKVQHMSVRRGEGDFALFLPMSCQGWPHVSFYPNGGGEGFGGNYFGTGDYVLKKWWGDAGNQRDATNQVITLDKVLWTDAVELRHRLGENIINSLGLGIIARVQHYNGDWDGLKRHQAATGSSFELQAKDHPTLKAYMHSGGITFGSREAWVRFTVQGQPSTEVVYTLHAPDSKWVIASPVPAR